MADPGQVYAWIRTAAHRAHEIATLVREVSGDLRPPLGWTCWRPPPASEPGEPSCPSGMADDLPILPFASAAEMEEWLEGNHAGSDGIWLKIGKKGSGIASVTYAEALELALCFGWIDSQKRGFDERFFLQRFTPRRPGGKWSRINREKAEALIASGTMRPAGLAEVEAAKADGR